MTTLLVVVAIAIVGAVVVLVARDRPLIEDDPVGSRALQWSGAEDLTAHDLAEVRFTLALRGYRMEQVDQVLDDTRAALSERDARIVELQRVVAALGRDRAHASVGETQRGFGVVDSAQDVGDFDYAESDGADMGHADMGHAASDHAEGEDRS